LVELKLLQLLLCGNPRSLAEPMQRCCYPGW